MVAPSSPLRSREDSFRKEKKQMPMKFRLGVLGDAFNDFRKDVRPIVFRLERDVDDGGDAGAQDLGYRRKRRC